MITDHSGWQDLPKRLSVIEWRRADNDPASVEVRLTWGYNGQKYRTRLQVPSKEATEIRMLNMERACHTVMNDWYRERRMKELKRD